MAEAKAKKPALKPPKAVRSMLDDENEQDIPDDFPVLSSAAEHMKIDVVVNRDNDVWVLYDQPFPDLLEWVEFDTETGEMSFITVEGKIQGLGMTIYPPMDKYVKEAKQVCLMMVRNKEICDMGLVPLMVQGYGTI